MKLITKEFIFSNTVFTYSFYRMAEPSTKKKNQKTQTRYKTAHYDFEDWEFLLEMLMSSFLWHNKLRYLVKASFNILHIGGAMCFFYPSLNNVLAPAFEHTHKNIQQQVSCFTK